MATMRTRGDRCPGVLRPWPAEDGLLVRMRLPGGRVSSSALTALVAVAEEYGDGRVHLTARANLQVRGLPEVDGRLAPEVVEAIEATGLLPSRSHELVRNVMVSPQTGIAGGRADLGPSVDELDRLLCADDRLADLPGRFLFVLDDGRGDLLDRPCDLGFVALDAATAQLRVGDGWGDVLPLGDAPTAIASLARAFLARRTHEWHVAELPEPLVPARTPDRLVPDLTPPMPYDDHHIAAPDGIDRVLLDSLASPELVITPWRGVLVVAR